MIVYSIVMTALFMSGIVALAYEHLLRVKTEEKLSDSEMKLQQADDLAQTLRITLANRDGVDAGNDASTLYKQCLKQFDRGEQITVMFSQEEPHYYARH